VWTREELVEKSKAALLEDEENAAGAVKATIYEKDCCSLPPHGDELPVDHGRQRWKEEEAVVV
jgi:hypothetical protein